MTDTDVQALEHERLQRVPQPDRLTELFTRLLDLITAECRRRHIPVPAKAAR